jgi:hypothetical protein
MNCQLVGRWLMAETLVIFLTSTFVGAADKPAGPDMPAKRPAKASSKTAAKRGAPQIPEVNRKIVEFCEANLGKRVGSGECAVLAVEALAAAGAKDRLKFEPPQPNMTKEDYVWGELLKPTDTLLPGDIIQFRDVELRFTLPNGKRIQHTITHHTVVVQRVYSPGKISVLQQNSGPRTVPDEQRQVVQSTPMDLGGMLKGKVWAYRPVAK